MDVKAGWQNVLESGQETGRRGIVDCKDGASSNDKGCETGSNQHIGCADGGPRKESREERIRGQSGGGLGPK